MNYRGTNEQKNTPAINMSETKPQSGSGMLGIHRNPDNTVQTADNLADFAGGSYSEKNGITAEQLDMTAADRQNAEEEKINEEAREVYGSGRALVYMLSACQKMHVGNELPQTGIILSYADTRVTNSKGLHTFLKGSAGSGKSHCAETIMGILPGNKVLKSRLSDKALFRMNLEDETMIKMDDQTMSEVFGEIFKNSTTDWNTPYPYDVTEKINGVQTVVHREGPKRCPFCFVKANFTGDEQDASRLLIFDLEADVEQLREIRKYQNAKAINPEVENDNHMVKVARRIWDFIGHEKVCIPFAEDIVCKSLENPRVYDQMIELTQASAVMAAPCRNHNVNGLLEASIEDFKVACRLLNSEEGAQKDTLGSEAKELLKYLVENEIPTGHYYFSDVREPAKMSPQRFHYALHGRDKTRQDVGGLCSLPGGAVGTKCEGREGVLEWNRELYFEFAGSGLSLFSMDADRLRYWQGLEELTFC